MNTVLAELTVTEEIGIARTAEVIVAAVRLPAIDDERLAQLAVRSSEGTVRPVQVLQRRRPLAGDPTWLSIAFAVDVAAAGTTRLALVQLDQPAGPISGAIEVAGPDDEAGYQVRWAGQRLNLRLGERFLVGPGSRSVGVSAVLNDLDSRAVISQIEPVQTGPLLAEFNLAGSYRAGDQQLALLRGRVRVLAGAPSVGLDIALVATTPGETGIDGLDTEQLQNWIVQVATDPVGSVLLGAFEQGFRAVPPVNLEHLGGGHPRGIFAVASASGGSDWQDASEPGYREQWEWAELHGRPAQNWCVLEGTAAGTATTVALERFVEHYPARISVASGGAALEMVPSGSEPIALTCGSAPRRRLRITAGADRRAGAVLDHPLVAVQRAEPDRGQPATLRHRPDLYPNLESLVRDELFGWYLSGQSLGFYDHGDGVQATPAGPRLGYSSNNEHDAIYALALHYLRSGERAYLDSAIAYADHIVDIDLVHCSRHPHEVGGVRAHGLGHVKYAEARTVDGPVVSSIDTGHIWTEGLVLLTELTGEPRYLDAARAIADCLIGLESLGWTRPEPGPRNAGWPLIALTAVAAATGDARYLDAAGRIAAGAIATQAEDGRWLMRLGYFRDYCAWQNAVLLTGLARLDELATEPAVAEAIRRGTKALLDLGRTAEGTFHFLTRYDYRWPQRSGLVREALAIGYRRTANAEFLTAGLAGGQRWYPKPGRNRVTSEDIAEWRGHLPFLACADEAGLLQDLP